MEERPNLSDIARRAGVHVSTVSRALSGRDSIPAATRDRITAIARELGYRMDPLTAALMRSRRLGRPVAHKANLGFLVAEARKQAWRPGSWIWEVFAGAKDFADRAGYSLDVFWAGTAEAVPAAFNRMLLARGIQGLLLSPEHEAPLSFNLEWERFAVLSLHYGPSKVVPLFHQLVSNHFQSVIHVCRRCRELGYRRIGLLLRDHPESHYEYGRLIFGAYHAGVDEADHLHAVPPLVVRELDPHQIADWARRHDVDAVIQAGGGFTTEFGPPQLCAALAARGLAVGRQLGLVVMAHRPEYGLAVVDERTNALGETAARMLIEMLQHNSRGVPSTPMVHQLEGCFHDGASLPPRCTAPAGSGCAAQPSRPVTLAAP